MAHDDLYNFQFLSLVASITQQIDNHTGLYDKTLAEFVIDLHDKSKTLADFKAKLKEAGADFPESFVENIDRLVLTFHPKHRKKKSTKANGKAKSNDNDAVT
jgi:ATP-dependent RNA helicase DHX8/PRP22